MSLETSVNIASHLPAMAQRQPDNLAVTLWSGESLTSIQVEFREGSSTTFNIS